ncbi:MAG: nucleoside kinase [Proteobacteria bacterium]|nr:nucleoside kinase [Pseudomonadota bacterium]
MTEETEDVSRLSIYGDLADIEYRGKRLEVPRGTTVAQLMAMHPSEQDHEIVGAVVNNRVVSLAAEILRSGRVEPVPVWSHHGMRIYRRHLTMMLYAAFYELHPGATIHVGQSISEGYYFDVTGAKVDAGFLATLAAAIHDTAAKRLPFRYLRVPVEEARRLFARKGANVKRKVLDLWPTSHVGIMGLGDFLDFCLGPVAPHTGFFDQFKLVPLDGDTGFVLQFPDPGGTEVVRNEGPQPKLYAMHKMAREWSELLGIAHVGDLNEACIDGGIREVIKVAEGLHEKRISDIADDIQLSGRHLIFVAGPSSAGKTTFAKRLSIQLRVAGLRPVALSLDNYYVDREKTPRDENGEYDFEALQAIDLPLFNDQLRRLLRGERVPTPEYNFQTGKRESEKSWTPIQLQDDQVIVFEGIHGLNDALTPAIPAEEKFRIYINALNPLGIDEHNRLHTSDTRLIRRIVRDRHYRGYSAAQTIASWQSVRRGERRHIFPFQESADVIFDTSLIYEFSVLKVFADRYLLEVPRAHPSFADAYRLRMFLALFVPVLPGDVPNTSLMREFIGGSSFSY